MTHLTNSSGKAEVVFEEFGFTVENIVVRVLMLLKK